MGVAHVPRLAHLILSCPQGTTTGTCFSHPEPIPPVEETPSSLMSGLQILAWLGEVFIMAHALLFVAAGVQSAD